VQDVKKLRVVERARGLGVAVYRLSDAFPPQERFGLATQMRRAAVSIGSNIAEGCGRRTNRELLSFVYIASGSASELEFQLRMAHDLGFGDPEVRARVMEELLVTRRMLSRLIAFLRSQPVWRHGKAPNQPNPRNLP
jgi:four helix bundle protein